jgi:hypothetical protein
MKESIMTALCEVCNGAGTLRDGSVCPRCDTTRWRAVGDAIEIARPKRQAWIRAPHPADVSPAIPNPTKARTSR